MKYSYVLWDFNGTIVNDVEICLHIMNEILLSQGKKPLSLVEYRNVFTFPVMEYYKRVGVIQKEDEFEEMAHRWMNAYYELEHETKLFEDISSVLKALHERGIHQGILSASRIDQLTRMVEQLGVASYMDDVLGISDIYAASKVHIGKEFIKHSPFSKEQFVMLGDTLHDYEVACEMGIDCILIAQGHQSFEVLSTSGTLVVEKASDVLAYLE